MRVYVLVHEVYFPYEGGPTNNLGVYSTRKKAREAAKELIRKDYPFAKQEGRKDVWDLRPGDYDSHELWIESHVLDE